MPCKAHVYPNGRFELWLNHPTDQIYFRLWERFIQDQHTPRGRKRKWVSSYFGYKVRLIEDNQRRPQPERVPAQTDSNPGASSN
ncbi:hypothetical protein Dda_8721 [Drechslerella dactyloides]|uniref:Uncharacterized protein n=1 Tax=Drechslerella dactyloides TaxID=74499 RepID=A0AAD6NG35_DREDA|nr:hypothetical protein Dda_8721 [Drechslerella dactyloides]